MYLAFHPFAIGPYSGTMVLSGLPRASVAKNIWRSIFNDFNEVLFKNLTDSSHTVIPGMAEISDGAENAIKVESARAHGMRKYQRDFQNSLSCGIYVAHHGEEERSFLFLPHPALSVGFRDRNGDFQELRVSAPSKAGNTWLCSAASDTGVWSLYPKLPTQMPSPQILTIPLSRDRCFRWASLLTSVQNFPVFDFMASPGAKHEI